MTDKPATDLTPDTDDPTSSIFSEYAEYQTRAKSLFAANKTVLMEALAAAGISRVVVSFDGCGDSGQIDEVQAYRSDETVSFPDVSITVSSTSWSDPAITSTQRPLKEAIEYMAYDILEMKYGGWEINDGAWGDFTFDVENHAVTLDYNQRFSDSEHFYHEF